MGHLIAGCAFVGVWLASEDVTSVFLKNRGVCIAGKPGSYKDCVET